MQDDNTPATASAGPAFSKGLGPLLDSEENPARLWAEIHRLRAAAQGPQGYATWQEAATAERVRRVKAEKAQAAERERCAKLCERIASPDGLEWPGKPKTYFCDDGTGCAGAIRMDGL